MLQLLIEVVSKAGLKHQIGRLLVHEEVVEFDYAGVIQKGLDFDLSDQLLESVRIKTATIESLNGVN